MPIIQSDRCCFAFHTSVWNSTRLNHNVRGAVFVNHKYTCTLISYTNLIKMPPSSSGFTTCTVTFVIKTFSLSITMPCSSSITSPALVIWRADFDVCFSKRLLERDVFSGENCVEYRYECVVFVCVWDFFVLFVINLFAYALASKCFELN